jgi:hypothetical protein
VYEADWERDCHPIFEAHRLPPDDVDPHDATRWRAALASRFGDPREDTFDHTLTLDAEGVLALYSSFSVIGGLPPPRRDAALAAFREVLDRHHVRTAELRYRAILTTARPGPREADPVRLDQAAAAVSARRQSTRARWRL